MSSGYEKALRDGIPQAEIVRPLPCRQARPTRRGPGPSAMRVEPARALARARGALNQGHGAARS
jgi:hypothetical protein